MYYSCYNQRIIIIKKNIYNNNTIIGQYYYYCNYFDKIMVSKRTWTMMINDPDQEISFYDALVRYFFSFFLFHSRAYNIISSRVYNNIYIGIYIDS